ncbi:MAG: hypothetical protein K8W52_42635 [Deltaproteobacteria bacterium]|nr:hypothetical protein [Deltaproteobacteria bacterium]
MRRAAMFVYASRFGFTRARGLAALLTCFTLAACVDAPDGELDDLGTLEAAVTTTPIFASTSLAKGASKTGTVTATGAGTLTFTTAGTGDADLYIKRGTGASATSNDCASETSTSVERCSLTVAAGEVISYRVYAYAASTVSLSSAFEPAATTTTTVLVPSGAIAKGASKTGVYTVATAGSITFRTAGTGDVDLYVRRGSAPTTSTADCKGETSSATETCTLTAAAGDKIYYLVYAYAASTASLSVTAPGPAGPPDYRTLLSIPTVPTVLAFTALSQPGGVLASSGRSLKFLIDNRTPSARTTSFLNGNYTVNGATPDYARYHYDFAKRAFGITDSGATFNQSTYYTQSKRFFAGTIQTYLLGDATAPVYAVQFYPDDVIAEETLLDALTTIKPLVGIPGAKLVFIATGPQQTFARIGAGAQALGIDLMTIDQVLGTIKYVGLNPGEAWGYLRIFPADPSALRPTDIPVFDELPLDLTVVAGVMTRAYQDINSHINLKSKERGTPNLVLRDASATNPRLAPWADQPIHLTVTTEGFTIEATTPQVIADKLAARLNKPWVTLPIVDETRLLAFDDLCPSVNSACLAWSDRLGGKATGLGFLASRQAVGRSAVSSTLSARYGYDLSPQGFAIPVAGYREFVNAPENALLKAKIDAFVVAEKGGNLSPAERAAMTLEIQDLFYKGRIAPATLAAITTRVTTLLPGVPKFKFRSSATSEDIENFNGAGLYDSFSAELAKTDNPDFSCALNPEITNGVITNLKMKPKTIQCAIKGVYASLWNPRAVDERSFARLDHATAGMGIAVNPSYDIEDAVVANAVLVTRVVGSDIYGYTLSVQKDNNLVTNPDPGSIAEFDVVAFSDFDRPPRFTTTRFAKPTATAPVMTTTVLTEAQMIQIVEMARTVETAYCTARPSYFPGGACSSVWLSTTKPRSLDMEIKVLANGHYVLKQVREFHGR